MAKLTTTQIKHVEMRLHQMRATKMELLKTNLPEKEKYDRSVVALKWAKLYPTKFVQLCSTMEGVEKSYTYFSTVFDAVPAVIKLKAKGKALEANNKERLAAAELKLLGKITRVMDDLYLGGADDATKAMSDFMKFSV